MNSEFPCGHVRESGNVMYEYGRQRCRECKRRWNREASRRRRERFLQQHGNCTAVPDDQAAETS